MYLGEKVITGGIMQQYFSIDSRLDRQRVSYMDLQYVFRYRLNPMFSIGFAPNMKWDQVTGRVTMPVHDATAAVAEHDLAQIQRDTFLR